MTVRKSEMMKKIDLINEKMDIALELLGYQEKELTATDVPKGEEKKRSLRKKKDTA